MERVNLNIPADARRKLKDLACDQGTTESELARRLVLDGLERLRRAQIYGSVADAMTPKMRDRLIEIAVAFERLDG